MTTGLTYTEVQHHLERLKLTQAQTVLDRLSEEATKGEWSYIEFLGKLLGEEMAARQERRVSVRQRLAHFPWAKTLDQFDFAFQPGVDKKRIRELAGLKFVEAAEVLILTGPPGVGQDSPGHRPGNGSHPGGLLGLLHQPLRTGGSGARGPDRPQVDREAEGPQLTEAADHR